MREGQTDTGDNTEADTHPRRALNLVDLETAQHLAVKTTTFPEPVQAQLRENSHELLCMIIPCLLMSAGAAENTRSIEKTDGIFRDAL